MNARTARNSMCKIMGSGQRKWSSYNKMKSEPDSSFMKIRCPKCKNEQIIFEKATTAVPCLVCGNVLAEPRGGKAKLKARPLEVL